MPAPGHVTTRPRVGEIVLRLLAAAGLAIDTYVHLDLAASYDTNTAAISQGALFRVEASAALAAAVLVLLVRGRLVALFAFLVAAGGVAGVARRSARGSPIAGAEPGLGIPYPDNGGRGPSRLARFHPPRSPVAPDLGGPHHCLRCAER